MTRLLNYLLGRLPEIREMAGSLAAAREQFARERQPPEDLALATLRAAWLTAPAAAPAVLVADLIAEAWTVLAEEVLAKGSLDRCVLALGMAEAAALEGSGDPQLEARLHVVWALSHRASGQPDAAHSSLRHLVRVVAVLEDPRRLAEAELWTYLFEREQGRDAEAEEALRRAGARVGEQVRSALLAQLTRRLNRLPGAPTPRPAPQGDLGPIANGHRPAEPDPTLEDTWEPLMPGAEPNH